MPHADYIDTASAPAFTRDAGVETNAVNTAPSLLSPQAVAAVRQANTQRNLQSNKWYEIANILRWCTTGLIAATMYTIFDGAVKAASVAAPAVQGVGDLVALGIGPTLTAMGTALSGGGVVLGMVAAVAVAATLTVLASQHSRKIFVDKSFDVQDFQMQRQAALVGKSVEHAIDDHDLPLSDKRWAEQFGPRDQTRAHAQRVQAESEALTRAVR